MCRPAICKTCSKTTWAGCGQHVHQVMAGVPREQRCPGHADDAGAAGAGTGQAGSSLLGRLFARR